MSTTRYAINPPAVRQIIYGLCCVALVLLLFRDTAAAMVAIWIRSETFQHAFLVPPIVAWLIWRQRGRLARVTIRVEPLMLIPAAAACLLWLLGELAEVAAATQFALVTLIVLSVPALYGREVARVLAFPLLFAFFAVPIGDFAVPILQEWTADVTVLALRLSGIPVYREGLQFVIPSGTWSVVEACSGIRYLIACFMVGTLYAYLNFRSIKRRLLVSAAALVIPVIANWVRAYSIVMIGHLTGSPMILGVEHTTYGWVLFGVVVMLMFSIAARWSDEGGVAESRDATSTSASSAGGFRARTSIVLVAYVAMLVGTQGWVWALGQSGTSEGPELVLPEGKGQWTAESGSNELPWNPAFGNPNTTAFRSYESGNLRVSVWTAYYRHQDATRKLVTSVNRVVDSEDPAWRYQSTGRGRGPGPAGDGTPGFEAGLVSRGSAPTLGQTERFAVWSVYWLNGRWTTSPVQAKVMQAIDQLVGRGDDGAVVLLVTPMGEHAESALAKFARDHVIPIGSALSAARESGQRSD